MNRLARISHRFSTATADKATLTRLFSSFDLDVTRHAIVRKASDKSRHSNLLHRLATKTGEISGLENKRNNRAPLGGIAFECLPVPAMVVPGPGDEVRGAPQREKGSWRRPHRDSPSGPLQDFAEIIGTRNPAVQAAVGNPISAVSVLAQLPQD